MRRVLTLPIAAIACTGGTPSGPADAATAAALVPVDATDGPARLRGSCIGARPLGAATNYRHVIELDGGAAEVNVRADPSWSAGDHGNVLGQLAAPQRVAAFGPLKGVPSMGIGWAVPLVDDAGNTCRGYVSATVARAVACDHITVPPEPFPAALDTTVGACSPDPTWSLSTALGALLLRSGL